jgi:hypothetical protein
MACTCRNDVLHQPSTEKKKKRAKSSNPSRLGGTKKKL